MFGIQLILVAPLLLETQLFPHIMNPLIADGKTTNTTLEVANRKLSLLRILQEIEIFLQDSALKSLSVHQP
jgi:hypothetical protein